MDENKNKKMKQVELTIPLQVTGQKLYKLWSVPNSVPRQKTYIYLFLIGITSLLIFFYSYPLNMENWTLIKEKVIWNVGFNRKEVTNISHFRMYRTRTESTMTTTDSILLQAVFRKNISTVVKNRQHTYTTKNETTESKQLSPHQGSPLRKNINYTKSNLNTIPVTDIYSSSKSLVNTSVSKTSEYKNAFGTASSVNSEYTLFTEISAFNMTKKQSNVIEKTDAHKIQKVNETQDHSTETELSIDNKRTSTQNVTTVFDKMAIKSTKNLSGTLKTQYLQYISTELINLETATSNFGKGYLVFSETCRIPDIDPWHPSIMKYVEKTPPLDCSEDYKPLTRTNGNMLILDENAILKRTAGENYTCCYKSVFRVRDGQTDNDVGYSECINMTKETIVKDEFICVICKYQNGTQFYQEFHSFIFDKPEVEERCRNTTKSQYSVLIIGADSVSRLNMHRQLNATASYLLKEMGAIEMYGYNKVGDNTFPNLVPLLTGYDERELPATCWKSQDLPLDDCNILWKSFAEKGYRTFYAEDAPHISTFNYVKKGFYHQPTDYYFRPFILAYESKLGRDKPLNCYQCVGSTSETEAVLNWAKLFALHFSDRPYFAFSWINSLTHDFLNMGSAGDYMYEAFFRHLHKTGALNKTIVILMSDHGMRWGGIRNTYVGRLEERLPMLLITLPQMFKQEYPDFAKNLMDNSHKLVTPYDLHVTLSHLLNLTNDWIFENTDDVDEELSHNFTTRAQSLFYPVPKDRSCDDAFIEEHWCTCETSINVDVKNNEVKRAAIFLLERINKLLKSASDKCAVLKLDLILDARLWQPPTEHAGHSFAEDIYTVVIQTNPSKAVFEGTVKLFKPKTKYNLLGTISRLNLYGNQSSCIQNAILKKYCYCL